MLRKCPICGREFELYTPNWKYKIDHKTVCSYECMRVIEREKEEKKRDGKETRIDI